MPFNFVAYKAKCDALTSEELQLEWQNYTRQLSCSGSLSATSVLMSPVTSGISLLGLGLSVPHLYNARKKRAIVGKAMKEHAKVPHTRKRDIAIPTATSIVVSGITLGFTPPAAELLGGEAGVKGIEYLISHATIDALWAILDEAHMKIEHKRAMKKLRKKELQEKEYFEKFSKMDGYSKTGVDEKKPPLTEVHLQPSKGILRPLNHEKENYHYEEKNLSPPAPPYSNKTVDQGRRVRYAYETPSSFDDQPQPVVSSQLSNQQIYYNNQINAAQNSRSSPATKRISLTFRPKMLRSDGPISPTQKVPLLQVEEYGDERDMMSESDTSEYERGPGDETTEVEEDEDKVDNVIEHVLTLEEEVSILKATILRLELDRRGLATDSDLDIDSSTMKGSNDGTMRSVAHNKEDIGVAYSQNPKSASKDRKVEKSGSNKNKSQPTTKTTVLPPRPTGPNHQWKHQENTGYYMPSYNQQSGTDELRSQAPRRPPHKRHDSGYSLSPQPNQYKPTTPDEDRNDPNMFNFIPQNYNTGNNEELPVTLSQRNKNDVNSKSFSIMSDESYNRRNGQIFQRSVSEDFTANIRRNRRSGKVFENSTTTKFIPEMYESSDEQYGIFNPKVPKPLKPLKTTNAPKSQKTLKTHV